MFPRLYPKISLFLHYHIGHMTVFIELLLWDERNVQFRCRKRRDICHRIRATL